MIGLPTEEQRQSFVNQLQMALFVWIKRNPAGTRPLRGLLVMDEAQTLAPSRGFTPSTRSTHHLTLNPDDVATADAINTSTGDACARWGNLVVTPPNGFVPHPISVYGPI
jgi:hypothetical protein